MDDEQTLRERTFALEGLPHVLSFIASERARDTELLRPRAGSPDPRTRDRWVAAVAARAGLEAVFVSAGCEEILGLLQSRAHLLVGVQRASAPDAVLLVRMVDAKSVAVLSPSDGTSARVACDALIDWILRGPSASFRAELDAVLDRLPASQSRRRVRAEMTSAILGSQPVAHVWVLRRAAGHGFAGALSDTRLASRAALTVLAYGLHYLCFVMAWMLVGQATLEGRIDRGSFVGALLLFGVAAVIRAWSNSLGFAAVIAVATAVKRWLLRGTLAIDLDMTRRLGVGSLLGLVLETSEVEQLALDAALLGALSALEVTTAIVLLSVTPSGWPAGLLLAGLSALVVALAARALRAQRTFTADKNLVTQELIDSVVGYRTRLAQCPPAGWHEREEARLEAYRHASLELDRAQGLLRFWAGRAGLLVGLAALALPVALGHGGAGLAAAVGAVFLAHAGLSRFSEALVRLIVARVAFERSRPLFSAGSAAPEQSIPRAITAPVGPDEVLLEARGLWFHYPGTRADVLRDASLTVRSGDRLVVEAPSGTGKSTLLSVLSGLRAPTRGTLFARGCERGLLGDADWGDHVVAVPQYHDNYVFSGTLAFNCLMGCGWPAAPEQVREAESLLEELALSRLLQSMPARMEQAVGETGWRLSHGERSRLYMARALLKDPDVVLLDESFGALDPETFLICLRCLERRARSVVLVAHR